MADRWKRTMRYARILFWWAFASSNFRCKLRFVFLSSFGNVAGVTENSPVRRYTQIRRPIGPSPPSIVFSIRLPTRNGLRRMHHSPIECADRRPTPRKMCARCDSHDAHSVNPMRTPSQRKQRDWACHTSVKTSPSGTTTTLTAHDTTPPGHLQVLPVTKSLRVPLLHRPASAGSDSPTPADRFPHILAGS